MGRLLAGLAPIALCAGLVWLWSGSERGVGARAVRPASPAESSPAVARASESWTLRSDLPFDEPPSLRLDAAALAAPIVRLVLRTSGTVPPPPYRFDCELLRNGSAMSQPDGPRWFTPERNEIRCLVASPGQLEVRWHLERKVEGESFGGAIGSHVLEKHWTAIEVLDVPGEQLFEVALDGAALDELTRSPPW